MNNPERIIMVRPAHFGFNVETAESNKFQQSITLEGANELALAEFDSMVETLRNNDIEVLVLEDTVAPIKPDAIFPNNWISFHPDGRSVLYPMEALNRRLERRMDVFELAPEFNPENLLDITHFENTKQFLEGTGSIIFDNNNKSAYCAISSRSDVEAFEYLCKQLAFTPISFEAHDLNGHAIYHTNVLLSIGNQVVVICSESISNPIERAMVLNTFKQKDVLLVEISFHQMNQFAANCLEINDKYGKPCLVMSTTAYQSFSEETRNLINTKARIIPVSIPTIEKIGGGSARCMMLGV
jgi:hypothetical protein